MGLDEKRLPEAIAGPFHVAGLPPSACSSAASKPQHRGWCVCVVSFFLYIYFSSVSGHTGSVSLESENRMELEAFFLFQKQHASILTRKGMVLGVHSTYFGLFAFHFLFAGSRPFCTAAGVQGREGRGRQRSGVFSKHRCFFS